MKMHNFVRPNLPTIHSILGKHRALIVHCSGTPKGSGSPFTHEYPEDLREVIGHRGLSGLSASVVMPGDEFDDLSGANATGCLGVVLGLQSERSLVDAHPDDCGSYIVEGRRHAPHATDMTAQDIEATITGRNAGSYNEWVVADYEVLGLFAAAPYRISIIREVEGLEDVPDYLRGEGTGPGFGFTNPEEILGIFPGQTVYSFVGGALAQYSDGEWLPVAHSQLYPSG